MSDTGAGPFVPSYFGPPPTPQISPDAPRYKLYDPRAVALATFLGSIFAGCWLLSLNYRRLGRTGAALVALLIGFIATVAAISIGWLLPSTVNSGIVVGSIVGMSALAKSLQGKAIEQHSLAGGRLASLWKAAGVGLVFMLLVLAIVFGIVAATSNSLGTPVLIGTKDHVYYADKATEADARSLGDALKKDGYLGDKGVTVAIAKGGNGTVLSFVVQDGIWDKEEYVRGYEQMARRVAPAVGGLPVKIHLLDSTIDLKKEMTVNP